MKFLKRIAMFRTTLAVVMASIVGLSHSLPASSSKVNHSGNQEAESRVQLFDSYGAIGNCDELARLDNFALQLQNAAQVKGYILVYVGKNDLPAWIPGVLNRARDYLVQERAVEESRITHVNGGYREERATELWIVPADAPPPEPSQTIKVTRELGTAFKFDQQSLEFPYKEEVDEEVFESEEVDDAPRMEGSIENQPEATSEANSVAEQTEEVEEFELLWASKAFAEALAQQDQALACLIFYGEKERNNFPEAYELVERGKKQLVEKFGVPAEKVVTIFGGYRTWPAIELWIVPPGAAMPTPSDEPPEESDMKKVGDEDAVAEPDSP